MLSVYLRSEVSTLSGFHCNKHLNDLIDYCLLIGAPRQSQGMKEQLELKLPKFCLWHVAWSLNICPAKFHATGKSCQKLIQSSMARGIFRMRG
jgi:hypothetical protein